MIMAASKTKAASAVLTFRRPHDGLGFAFGNRFTDAWIAAVRAVGAVESFFRRNGAENWSDAGHALAKAHVIVPFVLDCKWLHAASDGMLRQRFEIGGPSRIHRPIDFKVAANPIEKCITGRTFWDLDCIMATPETNAFLHELVDNGAAFGAIERMAITTIGIDEDRIGAFKHFFISGPAVIVNLGVNAWKFIQAVL